jgi:adenylate kinase
MAKTHALRYTLHIIVTHMNQKSFIFIGRSGCGKGTQGKLIEAYLKEIDPARDALYVQTGSEFRKFIQGTTITEQICKAEYVKGALMPEFLTIYMWSNYFVQNYNGNQHIIIDGSPRKYHEAGVMHSIFEFYKLEKPYVVYLDVSEKWAIERLLERHRAEDDKLESIKKRLKWFETEVMPTVKFYQNNPGYEFIQINGEQSVENIQAELKSRLKLE